MSKRIAKQEAECFLRGVEQEKEFFVNNGPAISNLEGLEKELKKMKKETFSFHVNKDKNDFSAWINDVIGDKTLARNLSNTRTKETLLKRVKERVAFLKKAVK
ncbi:MAG: hypothetical protein V1740_02135 [Candidatus Woesearchaeota archaeon]